MFESLQHLTDISIGEFLGSPSEQGAGLDKGFLDEIITAVNRINYGQSNAINALAGTPGGKMEEGWEWRGWRMNEREVSIQHIHHMCTSGMVSAVGAEPDLYSVKSGNKGVASRLLSTAGAHIELSTRVTSIDRFDVGGKPGGSSRTLSVNPSPVYHINGNDTRPFDAVIFAAPLEFRFALASPLFCPREFCFKKPCSHHTAWPMASWS